MRHAVWRFTVFVGVELAALLAATTAELASLPLTHEREALPDSFAGRAYFGREHDTDGTRPFRIAKWGTLKVGDCTIEGAKLTIAREGTATFTGKVKSKDTDDRYCVVLGFFDHRELRLWHLPKICTPFDLTEDFATWTSSDLTVPTAHYRFIAFATREDEC
jgi:hypothetical protein